MKGYPQLSSGNPEWDPSTFEWVSTYYAASGFPLYLLSVSTIFYYQFSFVQFSGCLKKFETLMKRSKKSSDQWIQKLLIEVNQLLK